MKGLHRWGRIASALTAASALIMPLAACGSSTAHDGRVTIEWWGYEQGQQEQADAFNQSQDKIRVVYHRQATNTKAEESLVNAVKAGQDVPDLFEADMDSTISLLAAGTIQNIAPYHPDLSNINPNAVESFTVANRLAAIPFKFSPQFIIANQRTFDEYGVAVPTNWDEYIQAGEQLKAANPKIKIINLAGEDPTTLVVLAQQFGAQWYSVKGDSWVIDINGAPTRKAVGYLQRIVDEGLFSQKTFIEWDALMQFFQSGNLATIPTSTWQLSAYQSNFQKSLGDWKAYDWPKESADSPLVSPLNVQGYALPKGAKHPQEALEFALWLATNSKAAHIAASPTTGNGTFPAMKDATPYIADSLPDKLLKDKTGAEQVVKDSIDSATPYSTGINWSSMYKQLQDQWAKFINKQVTGDQMLDYLQRWTVADLKNKGINVREA
ncbi:family 1 extracellular solute-binding protein [Bifidobacterium saguini DSM 23967]|uniref:Family 1 extracellular solute-binding protein n=2 Tax=Bifidobacterium saguini TaxID=762210 RepID=A0A087D9V1_9BIFI|nr:extracellular solute-binding protein [Bifidobacterium saguini]KFI92301.1 family 1 extracellular solute-binding protein [Bifidobacterium saguini DSM 23967]QTB91004.1 extracellular solute-binding protein [Bifidobacterium saguini]